MLPCVMLRLELEELAGLVLLAVVLFIIDVPTVLDSKSEVADMLPVTLNEKLELVAVRVVELANGAELVTGTADAVGTVLLFMGLGSNVVVFNTELVEEVVVKVVFGNGMMGVPTTVIAVLFAEVAPVEIVDVDIFQPGVAGRGRVTVVPSKVSTRVV